MAGGKLSTAVVVFLCILPLQMADDEGRKLRLPYRFFHASSVQLGNANEIVATIPYSWAAGSLQAYFPMYPH